MIIAPQEIGKEEIKSATNENHFLLSDYWLKNPGSSYKSLKTKKWLGRASEVSLIRPNGSDFSSLTVDDPPDSTTVNPAVSPSVVSICVF